MTTIESNIKDKHIFGNAQVSGDERVLWGHRMNHWLVLAIVLCAYMIGGYFDSLPH